ncbi:TPA: glycosyltransferase family 4 protein [Streptococcus suis]|nr:glycosyltransferase family 4 protein [Streptococcus suis]
MKKVLFVATVVKLHIMVFHIPYLEWFKKNGYEVHVAARNDYDNKDECIIPFCDRFHDLPFERSPIRKNNLQVYKDLKNIIDTEQYEIIHCHTPMGGAIGRLAARSARKKGTKVIYTAHGFHFFKGAPLVNWLAYYPAERWLARYTDVLITINTEDYEIAKKFKVNRIEYVPGVGIDTDKFKNIEVNRTEKRESLGVSEDDFMIISMGELNKNKNHQVIIRAIAKLRNEKIKYVLCGQGPLETELRELAKELDVENQVKFLGFRKDVPDLMKVADLFAFPSYREGLSLSLMEAMASGLPVVCSEIRGNTDLIEDGKGGYLVEPSDVEGFAKYIKELIEDSRLKSELGGFNLEKIEHYSIENVLCEMEEIYFN